MSERASIFVSFAYSCNFCELVDALEHYLIDNKFDLKSTFVWFDPFVNNQWHASSNGFEWWSTTFKQAISSIGRVCVILSPWSNPTYFKRAWCLWEMYCAIDSGSELGIAMSPREMECFVKELCSDLDIIYKHYAIINITDSTCWDLSDYEKIHTAIRATTGSYEMMNKIIFGGLRDWMISTFARHVET